MHAVYPPSECTPSSSSARLAGPAALAPTARNEHCKRLARVIVSGTPVSFAYKDMPRHNTDLSSTANRAEPTFAHGCNVVCRGIPVGAGLAWEGGYSPASGAPRSRARNLPVPDQGVQPTHRNETTHHWMHQLPRTLAIFISLYLRPLPHTCGVGLRTAVLACLEHAKAVGNTVPQHGRATKDPAFACTSTPPRPS
jgi:hypothetical protein